MARTHGTGRENNIIKSAVFDTTKTKKVSRKCLSILEKAIEFIDPVSSFKDFINLNNNCSCNE